MAGNSNYKSDPIKVMLTICVGFVVVYLATDMKWALYVALGTGLVGMFSTWLSEKIEWAWMQLTWILSKIVPNILMTIVFYVILFPVAIISRIFSKNDPLHLKNNSETVYTDVNKVFEAESFENPW